MTFDAITVGGGLAGSTFAGAMARAGHKVLVLEQETRFKDRVRGENMLPWGVAAARQLGVLETLLGAGAQPTRYWNTYMSGNQVARRDLHETTTHGEGSLNIHHPDMQEALLKRASAAGVEVKRGANVVGVAGEPDRMPSVTFDHNGERQTLSARVRAVRHA